MASLSEAPRKSAAPRSVRSIVGALVLVAAVVGLLLALGVLR
jgi:hypothetical protein